MSLPLVLPRDYPHYLIAEIIMHLPVSVIAEITEDRSDWIDDGTYDEGVLFEIIINDYSLFRKKCEKDFPQVFVPNVDPYRYCYDYQSLYRFFSSHGSYLGAGREAYDDLRDVITTIGRSTNPLRQPQGSINYIELVFGYIGDPVTGRAAFCLSLTWRRVYGIESADPQMFYYFQVEEIAGHCAKLYDTEVSPTLAPSVLENIGAVTERSLKRIFNELTNTVTESFFYDGVTIEQSLKMLTWMDRNGFYPLPCCDRD